MRCNNSEIYIIIIKYFLRIYKILHLNIQQINHTFNYN